VRAILLILLTCLMTSCLFGDTRTRRPIAWPPPSWMCAQTEQELTSAEQLWRTAHQARSERKRRITILRDYPSVLPMLLPSIGETAARFESFRLSRVEKSARREALSAHD
jgi:hypothetical protein